jgi:hypothetical protein
MIQKLIPRILNMESDETLVKPNEFSDAVNVKIDGDEGMDFGVIKYADGNTIVEFYDAGATESTNKETVTGFVEDEAADAVYIFCAGASGLDSIYMISNTDAGYKMTLVARSQNFDLDKDSLTVADILRTYDKSITITGDDNSTGSFTDADLVSDFNPDGVVDEVAGEGQDSFSDVTIFPNINQTGVISFQDGETPFVSNHTVIVQNNGTEAADLTFIYNVDVGGISLTSGSSKQSQTFVNGQLMSSEGFQVTVLQNQTLSYTFSHNAEGSFADNDKWDASFSIVSNDGQFTTQSFNWDIDLNKLSVGRGVPVYTPNESLDAGDFSTTVVLEPTEQIKSYSIQLTQGNFDITVPLTGYVYIEPTSDSTASHNPDLTYLQTLDRDGNNVFYTGDSASLSDRMPFEIINVNNKFEFDLVFKVLPNQVTDEYTEKITLKIVYTDETGGEVTPIAPNVVTSAPIRAPFAQAEEGDIEVIKPIVTIEGAQPFEQEYDFNFICRNNLDGLYAGGGFDNLSDVVSQVPNYRVSPYFPGNAYTNIQYAVNNFGGPGTLRYDISVSSNFTNDSQVLNSIKSILFIGNDPSNPSNLVSVESSVVLIPLPGPQTDPLAIPINPDIFAQQFKLDYDVYSSDLHLTRIENVQEAVDEYWGDGAQTFFNADGSSFVVSPELPSATISIVGTVINNADGQPLDNTYFSQDIKLNFTPRPQDVPFFTMNFWHQGPATGSESVPDGLNEVEYFPTGTGDDYIPLYRHKAEVDSKGGRNQVGISIVNTGDVPFRVPGVSLSNTRLSFSQTDALGSFLNRRYVTNFNYNSEYVDNNEAWMGYGAIEKYNTTIWQEAGLPDPPSGIGVDPEFASNMDANSPISNIIYSNGYFDLVPNGGWQANRYGLISNNDYTMTAQSQAPKGWFSAQFNTPFPINIFSGGNPATSIESADSDQYEFDVRGLTGWHLVEGFSDPVRAKWSPWMQKEGGGEYGFNQEALDGKDPSMVNVTDTVTLQPGEAAYMILNCNIKNQGANPDIYDAILYVTPPTGSLEDENNVAYKFVLRCSTVDNAPSNVLDDSGGTTTDPGGGDGTVVGSNRGSMPYGGPSTSPGAPASPRAKITRAKERKISKKSSKKAILRATSKRVDKNGRRY